MSIRPRLMPAPTAPPGPTILQLLWGFLLSVTGAEAAWRHLVPPSTERVQSWDIPVENDPSSSASSPADVWGQAFAKLKELDELMQNDYKEDIDTLLVFAGLFSAVLTTFIIATLDSLQEDYSQVTANALYHISQQLHDPTVAFLPDLPKFHPQRSDVRVNILWLVSLVISLLAALLSILVKQWLAEYMTWTSMVPSKNTVALRQYRAQGWDRWGVRRYREAIPVLLQLALVLFLCGLLDFLWNLQQTVAIAITTVAGTSLGVWIFVTLMPTVIAQCPYRSPLSWFSRRVMQAIGDLWSIFLTAPFIIGSLTGILIRFLAGLRTGTQAETMLKTVFRRTYSLLDNVFIALGVYGRVSWDFWDLRRMDDPAVVNSLAMAATGEVVIQFPSADVLSTMSAGAYKIDGETGTMWLPIDGLWSLLRGLIGDDPLTRAMVFIKLRISFTDELCAPGFSSKDFCHSVVRLVRCAIRTQRGCSPREISNARYVIDVSHIIAESEQSILPYHTTTLVWLLHRDVPDALVHVAERHLRSLSGAAWITNAAKWRWDVSEIINYLNAVSALLRQSRVIAAKADMIMIALHLTKVHLAKIEQDPAAISAMNELFDTLTDLLQRLRAGNLSRFLLRQDWCTILAEMMTMSSSARPEESVVPPGLASAVAQCLGVPPDDEWHTWAVLSITNGSRLSTVIYSRIGTLTDPWANQVSRWRRVLRVFRRFFVNLRAALTRFREQHPLAV